MAFRSERHKELYDKLVGPVEAIVSDIEAVKALIGDSFEEELPPYFMMLAPLSNYKSGRIPWNQAILDERNKDLGNDPVYGSVIPTLLHRIEECREDPIYPVNEDIASAFEYYLDGISEGFKKRNFSNLPEGRTFGKDEYRELYELKNPCVTLRTQINAQFNFLIKEGVISEPQ